MANCRPCTVPARIPTLLLGGATAKSLQFCGAEQAPKPQLPTSSHSHTCQVRSSPADKHMPGTHTAPVTAPTLSEFIRHRPRLSCLLKAFCLLLFHMHFLHLHYRADSTRAYRTIHHPSARRQLRACEDPQNLKEPARKQPRTWKHRPPEVMHTLVNKAKFVFRVQCYESKILNRLY